MNRDYFPHKYGFINVDEDNIYLTQSGNWSQTKDLREFREPEKRPELTPVVNILFIAVNIGLLALFYYLMKDDSLTYGDFFFILILYGLIYAEKKIRVSKARFKANFRIPLVKITGLNQAANSTVELDFIDVDDQQRTQLLKMDPHEFNAFSQIIQNKK